MHDSPLFEPDRHDRPHAAAPVDALSPRSRSIRARLEADARRRYPGLVWRRQHRLGPQRAPEHPPRRRLCWQDRTLLTLGIVLMALVLARMETARADDFGIQWIAPERAETFTELALDTEIVAEVAGSLARVAVTQRFRNPGEGWAEAVYRFPLPDGAAVDRLRITVGERIVEGEIRERQDARRVYQQARRDGQVAAKVEQERHNQFETRLANIGPGEEVRVSLAFLQPVALAEGMYGLRIPMTFTPRFEPGGRGLPAGEPSAPRPTLVSARARQDHALDLEVRLVSTTGLAAIESRYHDVEIVPEGWGYQVRLQPGARPDRAFELAWAPDLQAMPQTAAQAWDDGEAVYAQLMVVPPLPSSVPNLPREVVFVIDTSGSMGGEPIEQAVQAVAAGLAALGPDDRFDIVEFDSDVEVLFGQPLPVDRLTLRQAAAFLQALDANGGTHMAPALQAALSMPGLESHMRQVVFVTDGSVGNEGELLVQVGETLGAARLFTVSIGSAPNTGFMRKAAEVGRGSHTHIGRVDEVAERMKALWRRIAAPALTDIEVDWGQAAESYPVVVPDLYAGEPLWVAARLATQPREVEVRGRFDGQPWSQRVSFAPDGGSEMLAALWARRKVEALEDGRLFGMEPAVIREEVLDVALAHGLLTAYTAMVAVDRTPARPAGQGMTRSDVPGLLPAGTTAARPFPGTATGWKAQFLGALVLLLLAAGLVWFSGVRPPAPRAQPAP